MTKSHKVKAAEIFSTLRDRIVSLEYPPGMSINDNDIGKEFGVSRTPIRDTIKKLAEMGLVTVLPRYSTQVASIDLKEIRCAFAVRLKLEGMAGAEACEHILDENLMKMKNILDQLNLLEKNDPKNKKIYALHGKFHTILYDSVDNNILRDILDGLHVICARAVNAHVNYKNHSVFGQDLEQINGIYTALVEKDSEKAAQLCQEHVQSVINQLKNVLL
jgi:GntR family transcriptional regulator, rspAB operon transcriptional repressor